VIDAINGFSPEVAEKLGYYVYLYMDPDTNEVFYVGKGKRNRAFDHLYDETDSNKVAKIQSIKNRGKEPVIEILCHGLPDDETAYRVESAIIDLVGFDNLTNAVRGWRSGMYGRMPANQLQAMYGADAIGDIKHPVVMIKINRLFTYGMSPKDLYDATRGAWKIGDRTRDVAQYAFAVFDGIVQEVFRIDGWAHATKSTSDRHYAKTDGRWEFYGAVAPQEIRNIYCEMSVRHLWPQGAQNPIKKVNIP
jgi:hypothetical protein